MTAPIPSVGTGVDVHAWATDDRPLMLACLSWPGETGLAGHSDADVAAHAACNALFSAAGLGDLGEQFGTDDPQWAGASGAALLSEAASRVVSAGWVVGNIAVQIIGPKPKLAPRRDEAQSAMTLAAGGRVTIAASTTDGLGFTGRGDGLAAIATALLHRP